MRKALFTIILVTLVLFPQTGATPTTQVRASTPSTAYIPLTRMTPPAVASIPSQSEQAAPIGLYRPQQDRLYPQDIDPPETCNVSRITTLGQDVEHMLAPWDSLNPLIALDQPPAWKADIDLQGAKPFSDLEGVALSTEEIVATWQDTSDGKIYTSWWDSITGWSAPQSLGTESSSGKPAILSRGPVHYAVFARFGSTIKLVEYYMGELGMWQTLPNINDAVTDPLVISLDAGHMAVFYQTADGTLKFTEWEGAWLHEPISLSGPQVARATQLIAPEISILSRNENHLAVFGVNADGELWVRERMKADEPDWSNTRWVKLMEGVEVAKPAVASRHDNHIGVVVKDNTTGQPIYLWWSFPQVKSVYLPMVTNSAISGSEMESPASQGAPAWDPAGLWAYGWHDPIPLGNLNFTSEMTLVPRSLDSLSILGVADNILYEMTWSEQEGWGSWQAITSATIEAHQSVTAVVRRMKDIMLLGRRAAQGQAWSKHYSSQDEAVTEQQLSGPTDGYPRTQAVVIVEGRTVWVTLLRDAGTGTWQVKAQEISTGILGTLNLNHADSSQITNRASVAAADLEVDGSEEIVVATLQSNRTNIDLSLIEISFPDPDTLDIEAAHTTWQGIPEEGDDINVTIGNMDPGTYQKEIVVGYRGAHDMHFGVYQYSEGGLSQPVITAQRPYYWDDWCTQPGQDNKCSVTNHDMEITAGQVFDRYKGYKYSGDQLVILDLAHMQGRCVTDPAQCAPGFCALYPTDLQCVDYVQDYVDPLYINSTNWSLDQIEPFFNEAVTDTHTTSPLPAAPYAGAVSTGDMNADGRQDIVYAFSDRIVASRISYDKIETISMNGFPDRERSLAVGDIDLDGRAEAGVAYREIGSTAYKLVEMASADQILVSASHTLNSSRTLLVADTDNDTQIAELAGCKVFAEFSVIAVVNGVPRWYEDGQPIQQNGGYFGCTDSSGGGELEDGTTETYGGSLTIGYEYEQAVPLTGIKINGFRASVTGEFMYSTISETVSITSTTQEDGYQYGEYSLGMVVYNSTQFACYYYNIYPPAKPENKSRAMVCQPTGRASFEDFKPLEDWHSVSFKQTAGPSWVDVGHRSPQGAHTNDLDEQGNYASSLPIDASQVFYTWDVDNPKRISYSSLGGFESYWGVSQMIGGEQEQRDSYAWNVTVSAGIFIGGFQLDASGTYGQGWEEARMVTWEETLEMGGLVEKFQDDTRECYDVVPYVYIARAVTAAGAVYDYTVMDYYVPWIGTCALDTEEAGTSILSNVPHPE